MTDILVKKNGSNKQTYHSINSAKFAKVKKAPAWFVEGVLVQGQPAVIGGPKKTMKTSIALDLAISLGSCTTFLGHFPVPKQIPVAVFSGESGESVLRETAVRICATKEVKLSECKISWSFRLPTLNTSRGLERLGNTLADLEARVVILDPLYLCLLAGKTNASASNLYEIGPILAGVTKTCLKAGATPVFVHHATKKAGKKDNNSPPELDDLAFAGIGEFARQWILISRRSQFEPGTGDHELMMNVGGSAGHCDCWNVDIEEGIMNKNFTGRKWQVSVSEATLTADLDMQVKKSKSSHSGKDAIVKLY